MTTKLNIKPLSVNDCWKGERYKTDAYKAYETHVMLTLRPMVLPAPPYSLKLEFGLSSALADIDNPVKPLLDILQKKYLFNDKLVEEMYVKKVRVPKGKEYSIFQINSLINN